MLKKVGPFPAAETECLCRLPFYVFVLVAGADGRIDGKEFETFVDRLTTEAGSLDGLVAEVLAISGRHFDSLNPTVRHEFNAGGEAKALARLEEGANVLDFRLDEAESSAFKSVLLRLGHQVAEASGGVLGMGSKISKVERTALVKLAEVLCVVA